MIVTLSGSTRFEQDFIEAQRELSKRGILCFSLAVLPQHTLPGEWEDGKLTKVMGDLLYFYRIQQSDAVLVLGDGYIGQSTAREILWAGIQGTRIYSQRWGSSPADWNKIAARFWNREDDMVALTCSAREVFGA